MVFRAKLFVIWTMLFSTASAAGVGDSQSTGSDIIAAETSGDYPLFAMDPSVRRMSGSVEEKLDVLKGLGYAGLSTNDARVENLERVFKAAQAREMSVYALYMAAPLTTAGLELPDEFDAICESLGRRDALLWVYMPSKAFEPSDIAGDAVAVPALQAVAERAGKHGVKVALYHHRDNWAESFADAIRVAEKVDRSNFGVSFNLCHSLAAGEERQIPVLLRKAAPKLFVVTLNGADSGAADGGWKRLIQPIGKGTYDVQGLVERLREIGYRGVVGFQAFGIEGDAVEVLHKSVKAWRKMGG